MKIKIFEVYKSIDNNQFLKNTSGNQILEEYTF